MRTAVGIGALLVLVLLVWASRKRMGSTATSSSPATAPTTPTPTLGAVGGVAITPGLFVAPLATTRPQGGLLRSYGSGALSSLRVVRDPRLAQARALADQAIARWRGQGLSMRRFVSDAAAISLAAATSSSFENVRPLIERLSDHANAAGWTGGGGHELIDELVALG